MPRAIGMVGTFVIIVALATVPGWAEAGRSSPSQLTGATPEATPVEAVCAATGRTAHRDISYATTDSAPARTTLDVYALDRAEGCPPAPILFWIHGGGWRNGDKAHRIEAKAALALDHGWTLIAVNYRLTPEVMYPVPHQDVADAIAWSLDHAADYRADPDRVAIMGHSAGAGTVAALATDERYLHNTGLDLDALDCAIALDTEGYDISARGGDGGVYDAMFGTDPAAWPDASPVLHVAPAKGIPAFFIVTRGGPTRVGMAQDLRTPSWRRMCPQRSSTSPSPTWG